MDWYVENLEPEALTELRHALEGYLARHSGEGSDIAAAAVVTSELLSNAHRHAQGPAWVSLDWSSESPHLTVHDLGPGFSLPDREPSPEEEGGRGLFIVAHLTRELEVAHKRAGGARVSAELPVTRPRERSHLPVGGHRSALPLPEEAGPEGTFDKEPFLRALVVQLAQTVDLQQGPAAAEAAVTAVGSEVGGRMEDAYRAARGLTQTLTPEQIGDLFVQLKAAIDGDFYVIEANEERIVLGNRRCPFGAVVRNAPALCRMTSSVFGGIAARNRGRSAVQLEERIAVGDPECRVVVWLSDPPERATHFAHHYGEPAS